MKKFKNILFFQRRLILPSLIAAGFLSTLGYRGGRYPWAMAGLYYCISSLSFHYLIYERRNPHDYYFFTNQGISRIQLWIATAVQGTAIAILLAVLP